jgi:hypothetical protein
MANDKLTFFQHLDNIVRGVANGMTFGAADYIAGFGNTAVSGGNVKANISKELQRTDNAGVEAIAGAVVGSLAVGVVAASRHVGGIGNTFRSYNTLKRQAETAITAKEGVNARLLIDNLIDKANTGIMVGSGTASGALITSTVALHAGKEAMSPPTSNAAPSGASTKNAKPPSP